MVLNNVSVLPLTFLRSKTILVIFHEKHDEPFSALLPLSDAIRKMLAHGSGS